MKTINFNDLEKKINYNFNNMNLLINALTHKTFAFEAKSPLEYNERLEFLGDTILNFIVTEQLYKSNKYFSEGELTRRRSILVNNDFLGKKAKELNLGKFLLLGRGEKKQNGKLNPTNLANALEAIIGAIYLDSGIINARKMIMDIIYKNTSIF